MPKGYNVRVDKSTGRIRTITRLYDTDIVIIDHDKKTIRLNNGGWQTMHTKKCMNLILTEYDLVVFQRDGEWFISDREQKNIQFYKNNMEINYGDHT